jgi:hypothetical protein
LIRIKLVDWKARMIGTWFAVQRSNERAAMYTYSVKVRTKAYLWGSSGVAADLSVPLLLIIHNDLWGDPISLGSDAGAGETDLGTLQPGECWTIPLFGLRGVHATCGTDSTLSCMILTLQVATPE